MRNQHYVCLHLNYSYINLFIRNELNEKSILILLISVIIILFIYISHEIKREHYIKVQKHVLNYFFKHNLKGYKNIDIKNTYKSPMEVITLKVPSTIIKD